MHLLQLRCKTFIAWPLAGVLMRNRHKSNSDRGRAARDAWNNPFAVLLALATAALCAFPWLGATLPGSAPSVLFAAALASLIAGLFGLTSPNYFVWEWKNDPLDDRVDNFIDLVSMAEHSVVIATGQFNHLLYGNDSVVAALKGLGDGVEIVVYAESDEFDPKSKAFADELVRRKVRPILIEPKKVRHGFIVDGLHTKTVVKLDVGDHDEAKEADYRTFDPDLAAERLAEFNRARREPTSAN